MPRPKNPTLATYECNTCGETTEQLPGMEVMHTCRGKDGISRPVWKQMKEADDEAGN